MLDISKKIDKLSLEILKTVKEIADRLNVEFYLVGATVRDMILNYVYGIIIYRKTNDIDFAIRLKDWDDYKFLIDEIEKRGFTKDPRIMHRYKYQGMIVDLIPFGEISTDKKTITWPDKDNNEMNIIGFEDAYKNTEDLLIQTEPEIIIQTASVEGLVLLKFFAWNERAVDLRNKDAIDLYIILSTYLDAGNVERIFEDHIDIVDTNFDYQLGGARLLGRDINKMISLSVKDELLKILRSDKIEALTTEMAQYESTPYEGDEKIEWCRKLLASFQRGLIEDK